MGKRDVKNITCKLIVIILFSVFSGAFFAQQSYASGFGDSNGASIRGWELVDGNWCYYNYNGVKATGWMHLRDQWYLFDAQGRMLTGWQQDGGFWYYMKPCGVMAANEWYDGYWLSAGGAWLYQPFGGWAQDAYGWRYGDTSGWYAKDETLRIDDVYYHFNSEGLMTALEKSGNLYYLAIGNEITKNTATGYGQNASGQGNDYVHLAANALNGRVKQNVHVDAVNLSAWETQSWDRAEAAEALNAYLAKRPNLVTIQLGEHVEDLATYQEDYKGLIRYIKNKVPKARIFVIQDIRDQNGRQKLEQAAALASGAEMVTVSNLAGFVKDGYPNNTGMQILADNILQTYGDYRIPIESGWIFENGSWYYADESGTRATGWKAINSTWYFFKSDGVMAANEWCDGYWLSLDGAWQYQSLGRWTQDTYGRRYEDTSGWYPREEIVVIDGVSYQFDPSGYLITEDDGESFRYLAIGNSITTHEITDDWWQQCGMAASDISHDYVHVTTEALSDALAKDVTTKIVNLTEWETRYWDRSSTLFKLDVYLEQQPNLITIQLGENASNIDSYQQDYTNLILYIRSKVPDARILVVQDFWNTYPERQFIETAAAQYAGAEFVSLEDIVGRPEYYCGNGTAVNGADGEVHYVDHGGIAVHPGDLGMQAISDHIMKVFLR